MRYGDSGSREERGKDGRGGAPNRFCGEPALHLMLNGVNEVDCTEDAWAALQAFTLTELPEVDDVRPTCCEKCRRPAREAGRLFIYGHGKRQRLVVVLAALEEAARIAECWQRRYLCTACGAVMVVLPRGVMPRYLYTAGAIVMAFFLTAARPIGDGLSAEGAYAQQGMYRKTCWTGAEPYRWRSLDRWAASAASWWPTLADHGVSALLVALLERSGTGRRHDALTAALAAHVRWGRGV